ncbi:MAG TPA: hypothetical protein VE174_01115 [Actinomycetota bacterium]|nr:hypothetical protein [Actinomycetota bacterium]
MSRKSVGWHVACIVLGVLMTSGVAVADDISFTDADDSSGRFDIASYAASHIEESGVKMTLKHDVVMYDEWADTEVGPGNGIRISFDVNDDGITERTLSVRGNSDGSFYGVMFANNKGKVEFRGYARVWREDSRSVSFAFPRRMLRRGLDSYGWRVSTVYSDSDNEDCPGNPSGGDVTEHCFDYGPDSGTVTHVLK